MRIVTVTIDDVPPSNNKFMGRRVHPAVYQKEKRHWSWLVRAGAEGIPAKPIKKAVVEITYTFPDRRRRDPDNYSGKFLLDGLVAAGVIADDSFNNIELVLKAEVRKHHKRTVIQVKELKDEHKR
jgi:Holliday junction resolvase RusA-like endonuclease